jgi:hypothetical protein
VSAGVSIESQAARPVDDGAPGRLTAPSAPDLGLVEVDGRRFTVRIGGPSEPMEVETEAGERVPLLPWALDDHLRALDRRVDAASGEIRFDHEGFARDVLARSGVRPELFDELAPLALWWAAGKARRSAGEESSGAAEGFVNVGRTIAKIRPWTFGERARALAKSVVLRSDDAKELNLERYLRAMLEASVVALDPPDTAMIDDASALLDAVAALNAAGEREEDRMVRAGDPAGKALARATLRVGRALGFTPSQVWGLPAPEIDRIVLLLDETEAKAPGPGASPRRGSLADFPDAVIIHVEDG